MNETKIDILFQKKFEHFEQDPRPKVWEHIEARLMKKKKRRVLPMWFYGGAAALLALFILMPVLNKKKATDPKKIDPTITTIPVEPKVNTKNPTLDTLPKVEKIRPTHKLLQEYREVIAENNGLDSSNDSSSEEATIKETMKERLLVKRINEISLKEVEGFAHIPFLGDLIIDPLFSNKSVLEKNIFDVLKAKDSTVKEGGKNTKKWEILPSYGYTTASSFTNASPIDESLNSNPFTGNENTAFGISIYYSFSNTWSARAGIYKQHLSFTTRNIGVVSGVSSNGLSGVDINQTALTSGFGGSVFIGSLQNSLDVASLISSANLVADNASIFQEYGYLELPVELIYTLKSKGSFSVGVVSGFSALFLNKNNVELRSPQFNVGIGQANNLNSFNMSANLGIHLDYQIYKRWSLNLNPMVKVHLNTFSENTHGFRPYFLGVYTGIKYKF